MGMFIVVEHNEKRLRLDFPMKDMELWLELKKIGVTDISPVLKLMDADPDKGVLHRMIGEMVNLDEVHFLIKRMESLTKSERQSMMVYSEVKGIKSIAELINLTYSLTGHSFIPDISDMVQEYDGRIFPFYVYDPDETVVVLELSNGFGEKEYLYMPTDHVSLQKAKARLNVDRLTECRISVADNRKLPNCLMLDFMETPDITVLEKFNELCRELADLSAMELGQLEMILEYVGECGYSVAASLIRNMDDIEVLMNVTDDEQYGRYLIVKSGEIKVDEDVWPFIDYAAFGRNFRTGRFAETGYVPKGFVGFAYDPQRYTEYHGENREPLETDGEEPENSQEPLLEMSY